MSTPKDWSSALIAAGFTDRRSKDHAPSWRALPDAVGVHPSTLTAMRDGLRETGQATVDRVTQALGVDGLTISQWVGRARTERNAYRAPDEANLLNQDERAVVDKLIHLRARLKRGGKRDGHPPEAGERDEPPGAPTPTIPTPDYGYGITEVIVEGIGKEPWSLQGFAQRLAVAMLPEERSAADPRGTRDQGAGGDDPQAQAPVQH